MRGMAQTMDIIRRAWPELIAVPHQFLQPGAGPSINIVNRDPGAHIFVRWGENLHFRQFPEFITEIFAEEFYAGQNFILTDLIGKIEGGFESVKQCETAGTALGKPESFVDMVVPL